MASKLLVVQPTCPMQSWGPGQTSQAWWLSQLCLRSCCQWLAFRDSWPDNPPFLPPVVGDTLWPVLSTPCLKMDDAGHHPAANGAILFCCKSYLFFCTFGEGPGPCHRRQRGAWLAFASVFHTGNNGKCCGGICSPFPEHAFQATAKLQSQLDSPSLQQPMAGQRLVAVPSW